ncbi:MAG: HEPN domain-containing protein [Thermomicrobiales bacterium]
MNFDWMAFLDLARELGDGPTEAHQRSAISRAYYSAFHHAAACLVKHGVVRSGVFGHDSVWSSFRLPDDRERRHIYEWGFNLKDLRHAADYEPRFHHSRIIEREAERAIVRAAQINEMLDRIWDAPWPNNAVNIETEAQQLRLLVRQLSPRQISSVLAFAQRLQSPPADI